MCDLTRLENLLSEKRDLFLSFEAVTQEMLVCRQEELEGLVMERGRLIDQVEEASNRIADFCDASPNGAEVMEAVRNRCDRARLPEELGRIYDAGMRIKTVLSRLRESDLQAAFRLRLEQEGILKQIRAANQGVGAKAARFYAPVASSRFQSSLGHA